MGVLKIPADLQHLSLTSHLFLLLLKTTKIMSSQALKATVQQSVRMASQVVEQQSRHGGGFVWRAGVGYQYQGGQGGQQPQASEQQWKDQRRVSSPRGSGGSTYTRVKGTARSF